MIQEFQRVLRAHQPSTAYMLSKTQDMILNTFEEIFPETFDLNFIHTIYEEVLGYQIFPIQGQIQVTIDEQIHLNCKLIQCFISLVRTNFVHMDVYRALEEQTQKSQSTIRFHIKIQQELKMYLEYLETKIDKMQKQLFNINEPPQDLRRQIQILLNRQFLLQKQKINLLKKNQKLKTEAQLLSNQIQASRSPTSSDQKSIQSRKFVSKIKKAAQVKENDEYSEINASQVKEVKQTSKPNSHSPNDRESYRYSTHNYDLTQKKRHVYFPRKT